MSDPASTLGEIAGFPKRIESGLSVKGGRDPPGLQAVPLTGSCHIFYAVFIGGCSADILPQPSTGDDDNAAAPTDHKECERRLLYVAMTRDRELLSDQLRRAVQRISGEMGRCW